MSSSDLILDVGLLLDEVQLIEGLPSANVNQELQQTIFDLITVIEHKRKLMHPYIDYGFLETEFYALMNVVDDLDNAQHLLVYLLNTSMEEYREGIWRNICDALQTAYDEVVRMGGSLSASPAGLRERWYQLEISTSEDQIDANGAILQEWLEKYPEES